MKDLNFAAPSTPQGDTCERLVSDQIAHIPGTSPESGNEHLSPPLPRKASLESQQGPQDNKECSKSPHDKEAADRKRKLVFHYCSMRTRMHVAERDFDEREDKFVRENDDRQKALDNGEVVQSPFEFDMRQLQETQELTRELIEAEAEYHAAKDAAIAGGATLEELGSEIESGFLDDDDGYRRSEDEEEIKSAKQGYPWRSWLNKLPDTTSSSDCSGELIPVLSSEVEVDEWEARSIDICDSCSVRAEDPWRRRIDKWREICGLSAAR